MTALSSTRRFFVLCTRLSIAFWIAVTMVVLHVPGPSGFESESTQESVRGAWASAGSVASSLGALVPDILDPLFDDKTIHFGLFFVLAALFALERVLVRRLDRRSAAAIMAGLMLYAAGGEALQGAMGRIADLGDWVANVLGVLAGFAAVASARGLKRVMLGSRAKERGALAPSRRAVTER